MKKMYLSFCIGNSGRINNQKGFAFLPHDVAPVGEDITYGDTSISLAYIKSQFPQWKVEAIEWNVSRTGRVVPVVIWPSLLLLSFY